jgi:hypothetical protein
MICLSNFFDCVVTMVCQGSRALNAQAEKAESLQYQFEILSNAANSSNLPFLRLDGWNPHGYSLRQPPNLANPHARTCARTHARIRAHAKLIFKTSFQLNLEIGWVGWEVGSALIPLAFFRPTFRPTFSGLGASTKGIKP